MLSDLMVCSQLMEFFLRNEINTCVRWYEGDRPLRRFAGFPSLRSRWAPRSMAKINIRSSATAASAADTWNRTRPVSDASHPPNYFATCGAYPGAAYQFFKLAPSSVFQMRTSPS